MKFLVTSDGSEEGLGACGHGLPGCCNRCDSLVEALENMRVGIRDYREARAEGPQSFDPDASGEGARSFPAGS